MAWDLWTPSSAFSTAQLFACRLERFSCVQLWFNKKRNKKISNNRDIFMAPISIFLLVVMVAEGVWSLSGGVCSFLSLPSSEEPLHSVSCSFRNTFSISENGKEYILQEMPVFALVLTHFRGHSTH